jgi:Lecithin retinol acyltransferase
MQAEQYQAEQEFLPGSHVITPRRGFLHHGIYVGEGKVVHYAGSTHGLVSGPIEEIPLDRFTCGRPVWACCDTPASFGCEEVIRRARSRMGENRYRLISNNCEHFCEWCLRGVHRSYQIEAWLSVPGRAVDAMVRLKAKLHTFLSPGVGSDVELS